MRKLASIQKIASIEAIPGADNIEAATILGWQVVVRKGDFKKGDLCVYFEIDSVLPDQPWSEFMRPRKFRVKTIKLRGQISQGLALPIEQFDAEHPETTFCTLGYDVTEELGVTKHDPQRKKELAAHNQTKRVVPHSWMLRWSLGRWLNGKIWPRASGSWPAWFPKTDETRVQNLPHIDKLVKGRYLYMTEKLDGQSATFFFKRDEKTGLFSKGMFGVCSRNIWYKSKANNNWWNMADQLRIAEALENYCRSNNVSLAVQGEIVGEGIQGNNYKITGKEFYAFNVYDIDAGKYLNLGEKQSVLSDLGLEMVPILLPEVLAPTKTRYVGDFLGIAEGYTALLLENVDREGVVFRDYEDDSFSFKAISNRWLLKGGE